MSTETLLEQVRDGDEMARLEAIRELGHSAEPDDAAVIAALSGACSEVTLLISVAARRALDDLAKRRKEAARDVSDASAPPVPEPQAKLNLERFESYLTYPDDREVRLKAVTLALDRGAREALPLLLSRLEAETDVFVLSKLTKAIGTLGGVEIVPRLIPFLENPDNRVRANTVEGLATIQEEEVFRVLVTRLEDPDHRVRANVVRALKGYKDFDPLTVLARMVGSDAQGDRASALHVLSRMATPRVVEVVEPLLEHPDPRTREAAWQIVDEKGVLIGERIADDLEAIATRRPDLRDRVLQSASRIEERASEALAARLWTLREKFAARPHTELTAPPEVAPPPPEPAPEPRKISGPTALPGEPTEYDALAEPELKTRLDELEKQPPAAALAEMERAAHSPNLHVRQEARRRTQKLRRAVETESRSSLQRKQMQVAGAVAAIALLMLGIFLYVAGPAMLSLVTGTKPSINPSPDVDESPSSAAPAESPSPATSAAAKASPAPQSSTAPGATANASAVPTPTLIALASPAAGMPGASPAPGLASPGAGSPAAGTPGAGSPAPASPVPGVASAAPGVASAAPGLASPAPASPAPASPAPGSLDPEAPAPASAAPGFASPAPGVASPAPGVASPAPSFASPAPGVASPSPGLASPAPASLDPEAPAPASPAPASPAPASPAPASPAPASPAPASPAPAPSLQPPAPSPKFLPGQRPQTRLTPTATLTSFTFSATADRVAAARESTLTLAIPGPATAPTAPVTPSAHVVSQTVREIVLTELASAASSTVSTAGPAHSPVFWNKSLAWLVGPAPSGQLWFRNSRGTRPLTDGMLVSHPTLAGSALRVALQINAVDAQGRIMGSDIAMLDLNSRHIATLQGLMDGWAGKYLTTTAQASLPAISPDGARVAFVSQEPKGPHLMVQDIASGKSSGAPLGEEVRELVWPAQSNLLLALVRRGDVTEVCRMDPAAPGVPQVLFSRKGKESILGFAVDPTARRLVIATARVAAADVKPETAGDLWLTDGAGAVEEALTNDGTSSQPALSDNGGAVAFRKAEPTGWAVYSMPLEPLVPKK